LVQVDYVRVVDLDIGANKSDIRAVKVVTIRNAPAELEPATARWENVEPTGRPATDR
jgi:hypothetical protein